MLAAMIRMPRMLFIYNHYRLRTAYHHHRLRLSYYYHRLRARGGDYHLNTLRVNDPYVRCVRRKEKRCCNKACYYLFHKPIF
jgi:hypothetical protein